MQIAAHTRVGAQLVLCEAGDKELEGQKCFDDEKIWEYLDTNQLDIRYMNSEQGSTDNNKHEDVFLKMRRPDHFGLHRNFTQHFNIEVAPTQIKSTGLLVE